MRNGYQIAGVTTEKASHKGIEFKVQVYNATDGHNVPTGFIGERLVYLQVTVTDNEGTVIFKSGDLDPNGDVRDTHSVYVHDGLMPQDKYLFSLQSRFLTENVRGGEREQVLPINYSVDPLPFTRPSTFSAVLTGRPAGARIHRQGIRPLSSRWPKYKVKESELTGKAPYTANVKLFSAMVPVNLVYEIKFVGFDYGMSAREVADAITSRHALLWEYEATIDPEKGKEHAIWKRKEAPITLWEQNYAKKEKHHDSHSTKH